ncbi:MAG TPA: hypothetical protein VJP86_09010 [Vicinamibacterales bacterium]|jgi:hypothetical protein|nr:hypothetical protein [Vicinamibacterales bacterium]
MIHTPPIREVDGLSIHDLVIGHEYEVGNNLAALLLAEGWAEPIPLEAPRQFTPFSHDDPFDSRKLYPDPPNLRREFSPPSLDRGVAADLKRRRK